jgi:hypothetical protein
VKLPNNMGRRVSGSTTRCERFRIITTRTPEGDRWGEADEPQQVREDGQSQQGLT